MNTFLSISVLTGLILTPCPNKTIYNHFKTDKNEVALTFDDGPDGVYTLKILEVLKSEGVKATFFMLGESAVKHLDVVKKVQEAGHSIGLHSYTHPNMYKLSYEGIIKEIEDNQNILFQAIGYRPQIIRPPYGIITDDFLKIAALKDLTIYTWSNDSFDWKKNNGTETIINNVTKKLKPGSIILMHDKSKNVHNSFLSLRALIRRLKSEGYSFRTLTHEKTR